jgi:uncharacterized protein (TIGR03118 family)
MARARSRQGTRRMLGAVGMVGALTGTLAVTSPAAVASSGSAASQRSAASGAVATSGASSPAMMSQHRDGYRETAVVADTPGVATVTDPHLVNPWGIAFGPTTPLWVSNNGTASSTLYAGGQKGTPATIVPLVVATPPAPTGVVFNDTPGFRLADGTPSRFVFATMGGQIAGWPALPTPPTATTTLLTKKGAVFTGLALAHTPWGPRLFAADAAGGVVREYNGRLQPVAMLRDRHLPPRLAPYNVAVMKDQIYVSYALPEGVTARVQGAVDVFSMSGSLQRRLITGGVLSGPWGMVMAPSNWGRFSGDLLIGNEDGGRINAFDPRTGHFQGTLRRPDGSVLATDGLWGMHFGNGTIGTPKDLVVAIGTDAYQHGLIAFIRPARG